MEKLIAIDMKEGVGARVKRLFPPLPQKVHYDPFVLMDEFFVEPGKGFPDHPHQGFEGITYMINGGITHCDSLGNSDTIIAGQAQRFTSGPGFSHSETPTAEGARGIQLWVRLAKSLHKDPPAYQCQKSLIQTKSGNVTRCKIVDANAGITLKTEAEFTEWVITENEELALPNQAGWRHVAYVSQGSLQHGDHLLAPGEGLTWTATSDAPLNLNASKNTRFFTYSAKPHGEKIILHGPFVK